MENPERRRLQRDPDVIAAADEREQSLRAAEELPQVATWEWEVGSDRLRWSDQVHVMFGTDPAQPPTTYDYKSMIHPDDLDMLLSTVRSAAASGGTYEVDHRIVRRDGEIREVRVRGRAEVDANRQPTKVTGSLHDVTEVRVAARELRRSRDLFAGVLDAATEQSIIATDPQGVITVFNTGAERMLGYSALEMIGTSPERLHDPSEIRARAVELGVAPDFGVFLVQAAAGRPETRPWTYVTRDGRRLLASITVSAMRGPGGEVTGFIKVGTDITERVQAEVALQESESRFHDMFQYAPNGMMLLGIGSDNRGRFLQVNPAMCRLTGYSELQLLGMNMSALIPPSDLEAHRERFTAFQENPVLDGPVERQWIHADGSDLWVQLNVNPGVEAVAGAFVVGQVEDITARKRIEETLRHRLLHDALTGLPNRALLMDRLEHALSLSVRTHRPVGVLYFDLDGFKAINDTAGHAGGDQALIHVAQQVTAVLRPSDTVARLGGDEFAIVVENLDSPAAATVIANRVLTCLRTPFTVDGEVFALSGSIGVSLSADASSPEQLVQQADQAMYMAKESGKGRVQVGFNDNLAHLARSGEARRVMRLTAELGYALERDELVMFGQPVLDLATGAVVAVESLLRWAHPTRAILAPGEFLDVAESTDLIFPIGRRVLRESCRMAASWVDQLGDAAPAVHGNVSGRQLEGGSLHDEVLQALNYSGLEPSRLVLELTETQMPLIANSLKADLQGLRELGVKIAIDDLGTGYSSLTRITELPVDILKIDLSFVAGMEKEPSCSAVVRGILSIGDALGLTVIAEGVETPSQAQRLSDYGCTTAQGYYYSLPLPEEGLKKYLAQAHSEAALPFRRHTLDAEAGAV